MNNMNVFKNWSDVLDAPRSKFIKGHTEDTVYDRKITQKVKIASEALFTQSNARILLGQAANGSFRFAALPTRVYPAATSCDEFGFGPGMYYFSDIAMYVGNLSYSILKEGSSSAIDLSDDNRENETVYADYYLPLTHIEEGDMDITLISLAPVAPDAERAALSPAPLPGPGGCIYAIRVLNKGKDRIKGKVILNASDLLIGRYESWNPEKKELISPIKDLCQETLILTRPDAAVGIHLHDGKWTKLDNGFQAEGEFNLLPGEEKVFETHIAMGAAYTDIMPVIYELHMRSCLDWLNLTSAFWRERFGMLTVAAADANVEAESSLEIHIRNQLDNFNCLQTDSYGNLISHWQGAPSRGGTIWGIDVEPTAISVVHICPELTRQVMLFFLDKSRVPTGNRQPVHSVPILVAPVIIARQWLQTTGDLAFFSDNPQVVIKLKGIISDLMSLKPNNRILFPSLYSSDGQVGRKYDYGTNVKCWYAFNSMAYILSKMGFGDEAKVYNDIADGLRASIEETMVVDGPFGKQISGGTNLGEDPGPFYLPEEIWYYDGEDTTSMLAPVYGIHDFNYEPWVNYHRFARSLFCSNYDPEFDTLLWFPSEPAVIDGTALVSRVGGSITRPEMKEAFKIMKLLGIDDVTGSLYWWPSGYIEQRTHYRCSQGQGAWAWQYMHQWLGVRLDAVDHTLELSLRGLLQSIEWKGFKGPGYCFDIKWEEQEGNTLVKVKNLGTCRWKVKAGFRCHGTGAENSPEWMEKHVEPGHEALFHYEALPTQGVQDIEFKSPEEVEKTILASADGIVFKRYGPAYFCVPGTADTQNALIAMRFVVANYSLMDWKQVSVTLTLPEGWLGSGRKPGYMSVFSIPEMGGENVTIQLGELQKMHRTVSAFSLKRPNTYQLACAWDNKFHSFHLPSQPGEEINLYSNDIRTPEEFFFKATLEAEDTCGNTVRKNIQVSVKFLPLKQ